LAFAEWSILEVIAAAQIIKGRVEVINLFEKMLDEGAREVPDLHNYLREYPWLINPTWDTLADEQILEKVVVQYFKIEPQELPDGRKRFNFL